MTRTTKSMTRTKSMTLVLKALSALGLVLTVGPSFFVFAGLVAWETHAWIMAAGTALWFATAPFWIKTGDLEAEAEVDDAST